MKKKCLLTVILVMIIFVMLSMHNMAFAVEVNYDKINGIRQFVMEAQAAQSQGEGAGQSFLGKTIRLNLDDMYQSEYLYCVQHDKASTRWSNATFRIMNYLEIDHNTVKSWHFPNGNSSNDAENDYSRIDYSEITTVKESSAAALALALNGVFGQTRYRVDGVGNYTETQKMLWPAFYYFLHDIPDGQTNTVGAVLGLNANTGSIAQEPDSETYRLQLYDALKNGATQTSVSIYFLRCVDGGSKGASQWQQMIIAIPKYKTTTTTINKVDANSGATISRTTFIIRDNNINQYIASIEPDGVITYTSDENQAKQFTTGISTYQPIVIEGLAEGIYTLKEIQNLTPGYSSNAGKEFPIKVNAGGTTVSIKNSPDIITGDDDDDDDDWENKPGSEDGNVTISGTVWEDALAGKANTNNSSKDSGEKGIQGVRVYWRTSSGSLIASTETDSSGNYEMKGSITIYNHEYSVSTEDYSKFNDSYIEFEYNGLKYTTVKQFVPEAVGEDGKVPNRNSTESKAQENSETRTTLDNYFDEVNNQGVLDSGQLRYPLSYTTGNNVSILNQNIMDFAVKADTKKLTKLLDTYAYTETSEYCVDHEDDDCDDEDRTDEWNIKYMNLGLVPREQPDIAITSDIQKVRVIMKGQEYTYLYGNRNITSDVNVSAYTVSFEKKYNPGVYTRPVNPSDIAYIQDAGSNEMQVYVTYIIRAKNQSETLPVRIREIVNYYDDDYEINSANSSGWTEISKYNATYSSNGYKAAYTTQLDGVMLQPQQISDIISIEFRVKNDTVKSLINNDEILLNNISEINGYTTFYGADSQCAENKTAQQVGKTNTQYSGVDVDSAPGNTTPGTPSTYEDDTDIAPTFRLNKNDEYKIISGTVWEDTDADNTYGERLGNGVKDGSERGVANVKVELLKAYDEGEISDEVVQIYRIENGQAVTYDAVTYTDSNGDYNFEGIVTDNYVLKFTYGDADKGTGLINNGGSFSEHSIRASTINGNSINARNYKSTIITQDPIKAVFKDDNGDDKWHLTLPNNSSIAIDDLDDRLSIPSLQYSNFNDKINMTAYSPSFRVQVEYTEEQTTQVDENGGDFENKPDNFDFGIIERPREDIVIDKTIENLKITLANGQVLTEGNPYTEDMNYVRALGQTEVFNRNTFLQSLGREKALYIEMDTELIQGARLDILYAITVTNNSEIDYEYDSENGGNGDYYFYGEANSPLIKPSAELVVDYVDTELTCTTETDYNVNWTQITNVEEDLFNRGYISNATLAAVKNGNYLVFTTDVFKDLAPGESHKEYLFASKLLANQAEDYVYENHAEIIQLNGKIARNIDSVANSSREQVRKTYKPGDYVPSLYRNELHTTGEFREEAGLHQQDDDMITIRITPPTGLSNNIILYISVGAVALVVLSVGIIIIRKKVLGK